MNTSPELVLPADPAAPNSHLTAPGPPVKVRPAANLFSLSTAFFPGVEHTPASPDFILMSSDDVLFFVHSFRILSASHNSFNFNWLPDVSRTENEQHLLVVPESSPVLNIMLHVVYDLSCNQYAPSNAEIIEGVEMLQKYGFSPRDYAHPSTHLYRMILARAPVSPMDMYVLAARHNLEELAVAISSHLLSFDLSRLTDELVERMGAVYLRRLVSLHLGRVEALKQLLSPLPLFHGPTPTCGKEEQSKLTRAWSLAIASLAWDARPDLPPTAIESALGSLLDLLSCTTCRTGIQETVMGIISAWVKVTATI